MASWGYFDQVVSGVKWRFLVVDSNKEALGSRWREQLFWLPKAAAGDYEHLLVFMHDSRVTLATDGEMNPDGPIPTLDRAGFAGTLATNSELEFFRYLKPGDHLRTTSELESISVRKRTGLGEGYFITWITRYFDQSNELVGQQLFRILKFDPSTIDLSKFGGAQ